MTLLELVDALNTRGIGLQAGDGKLIVTAPRGAATPDIRSELAARKPELITLLSNPNLRFWTAPDLSKDDANALDAILAEPPGAT